MSHHEEKNQAAKAKEKQNQYGNNKPQNQQGKQPGQPGNRSQGEGREVDSASQLRWSENERNERNERGERNTYDR
jgi:hypothetical protein